MGPEILFVAVVVVVLVIALGWCRPPRNEPERDEYGLIPDDPEDG